jgi:hypothetical protein
VRPAATEPAACGAYQSARLQSLGMRDRRPKILLKKFLFTKQDERLITEKSFIHLFYIQARKARARVSALRSPHHTPGVCRRSTTCSEATT